MTVSTKHRTDELLLCNIDEHVATLTLNRPEQFNALSEELLSSLQHALDAIASDHAIAVVILQSTGKAFCAGHDLKQMQQHRDQSYYQSLFQQCSNMMRTITEMPQPVIAKVDGMATAAGCQLVATCDLAIASNNSTFGVSGINLGLFCSTPSVALSRNIARKRAFEMLITGEFIDAEKAADWGLINRAVPASELDQQVDELCQTIVQKPAIAVRTGKSMFYQQLGKELSGAYNYAGDVMAENMMDADTNEGINAFIEKRHPSWKKN